jgi:hypothetical protein
MDLETIVRPAFKELNTWCGKIRVELNNHGEPTVHPRFFEICDVIKQECPKAQIQLQTNGYAAFPQLQKDWTPWPNFFEEFVNQFFAHGGNLLALNCYREGFYEYAMEHLQAMPRRDFRVIDFYHDNPENLSAYRYYSPREKMAFVFDDLGAMNVNGHANKRAAKKILNEAGNSPAKVLEKKLGILPLKNPLKKGCSRVFRELTIGWNGVIPACCYDWLDELIFGKFPEQSLQAIWKGSYWQAARVLLHPKNAERHMSPCDRCDYNGGFRLGLIEYPKSSVTIAQAYDILLGSLVSEKELKKA